jgi:hypothetical protein
MAGRTAPRVITMQCGVCREWWVLASLGVGVAACILVSGCGRPEPTQLARDTDPFIASVSPYLAGLGREMASRRELHCFTADFEEKGLAKYPPRQAPDAAVPIEERLAREDATQERALCSSFSEALSEVNAIFGHVKQTRAVPSELFVFLLYEREDDIDEDDAEEVKARSERGSRFEEVVIGPFRTSEACAQAETRVHEERAVTSRCVDWDETD